MDRKNHLHGPFFFDHLITNYYCYRERCKNILIDIYFVLYIIFFINMDCAICIEMSLQYSIYAKKKLQG